MKSLKIAVLLILLILLGCGVASEKAAPLKIEIVTLNDSNKEYIVEIIEFENSIRFEFHEVYNNKLSIVELNETYSSNKLFLLDFNTYEITEIKDLKKENEQNRIWNFIELDKKSYLYTEISYFVIEGFELIYYKVKIKNNSEIKILTEGYINDIYSLPIFYFHENSIYFTTSSLDFEKNPSIGEYKIEIWKGKGNEFQCIQKQTGGYFDFYLNKGTQYFFDHKLYFFDDRVLYLTSDEKNVVLHELDSFQKVSKIVPSNENLISFFPVQDNFIMTEWNGEIGLDERISTYVLDKELNNCFLNYDYYFEDYCVLDNRTIAYYQGKIVELQTNENNIFLNEIKEIEFGTYFRKIDGNSLLIFYGSSVCYKVTFK